MAEVAVHPDLVALVDDADLPLIAAYKWRRLVAGKLKKIVYAQASTRKGTVLMHRLILAAKPGELVDHKNHDGLDNRRVNIRCCTPQQNNLNRKPSDSKSGFKCVSFEPERGNSAQPWRVRVRVNGKRRSVGRFPTPEAAHEAHKFFVARHHGEFACAE